MTDVLLVMLYLAAGIAAAWYARRKGYDDRLFLILGVILRPILLIAMWFLLARSIPWSGPDPAPTGGVDLLDSTPAILTVLGSP